MDFLAAIENLGISTWIRESNTVWSYPTIIFLHSVGLTIVVGLSVAIDLRLLGFAPKIPLPPLERLFPLMWFGFWINAASGVLLLMADASTFLRAPLFYIKLGVIVLAAANLVAMRRIVFRREDPPAFVTGTMKFLAASSLVLWLAAMTAGRLTAYIGPAVALNFN
jgi:hypothetical protein